MADQMSHAAAHSPPDPNTGDVKEKIKPTATIVDFNVEALETVTLHGPEALMERDMMSPYVWQEPGGRFGIMVRAVPKAGKKRTDTGQIWAGWGTDGVNFDMMAAPTITGGPDANDIGGVEDPTVLRQEDGSYVVYFTAVTADMSHG